MFAWRQKRAAALVFATVTFLSGCSGEHQLQQSARAYRNAAARVEAQREHDWLLRNDAQSKPALRSQWTAAEHYAARYLAEHPEATEDAAAKAIELLIQAPSSQDRNDQSVSARVLQLQHGLWLVAVNRLYEGQVFLVKRSWSGTRLVWEIATAGGKDDTNRLHDWSVDSATEACRIPQPHFCGPLYASIGWLPPSSKGMPRFYVGGLYAQSMGGTMGEQTSIWRWNGRTADPMWGSQYEIFINQKTERILNGNTLEIEEKQDWHIFFSCGSCNGRQVLQRIQLTGTGAIDLGKQPIDPWMDAVDELFLRLAHGTPTADMASAEVRAYVQRKISAIPFGAAGQGTAAASDEQEISLGMVTVDPQTTPPVFQRCFQSDETGAIVFRGHGDGKAWYFDRADDGPAKGCPR